MCQLQCNVFFAMSAMQYKLTNEEILWLTQQRNLFEDSIQDTGSYVMDYEAFCSCQEVLVFVLLSMEIDSKLLYA